MQELGFKAVSDYVPEVTLENPTAYFLDTLLVRCICSVNEAYNEFGTAYGTDADKMVYNGAFKIASGSMRARLFLKRTRITMQQIKLN